MSSFDMSLIPNPEYDIEELRAIRRASIALLTTGLARHEGVSEAIIMLIVKGEIPGITFDPKPKEIISLGQYRSLVAYMNYWTNLYPAMGLNQAIWDCGIKAKKEDVIASLEKAGWSYSEKTGTLKENGK